ncbi:preprotein translocase subunit SecG [Maricaulaceae bacterium MS644]
MTAVLLIIQFLVAVALTVIILMQRSEGGALGMGGGGAGGMMTGRSAANILTRTTMLLGAVFIGNSILLAVLSGVDTTNRSVVDRAGETERSDLPFGNFDEIPSDDSPAAPGAQPEPQEGADPSQGEGEPPADLPNR